MYAACMHGYSNPISYLGYSFNADKELQSERFAE